jgi:hypothetical protein
MPRSHVKVSPARVGQAIAIAGAVLIASMTLVPHPELTRVSSATPLSCLLCGDYGVVDVFLNILLFIPFGLGLRLMGVSRFRGQALLMVTSLCIELLQLKVIAGRDASLSDFLTNSLGGGLGIWLADHWSEVVFPSPARSRRLRIPAALAWLAVWIATAWLVEPSIPHTIWFGQLAAQDVLLDNFKGVVLSATVNARQLDTTRLSAADSAALLDKFVSGSAEARAKVVAGPQTALPAPIVSIFDRLSTEILVLGQDRGDLIFRIRLGTADHELHEPEIRLPEALATPGDTVFLAGGLRDGHLFVQAKSGNFDQERAAALSPSWGWMFVLPWHYAMGPEGRWLTTLWVAGLLLPAAFLSARGLRRRSEIPGEVAFLAAIVLLGLAGVPRLAALPPVHWSEWLAAGVGIAAGWWLGRRSLAPLLARAGVN